MRVGEKTMPDSKKPAAFRNALGNERAVLGRSSYGKIHPRRLSHVLLFPPDVPRQVAFYESVIGLRMSDKAIPLLNHVKRFVKEVVQPMSEEFHRLGEGKTDIWSYAPGQLEVLEAAGSKWNFLPFRPGMVGGHCIGVDPYYLTHKAEELVDHPQIILAGRRMNDNMARYAARNVIKRMLQNGIDVARSKVGVMGITFKENCPDIRNSKVVDLVKELQSLALDVELMEDASL